MLYNPFFCNNVFNFCGVTSNAWIIYLSFLSEQNIVRSDLITSEASLSSMGIYFPVGFFQVDCGVGCCYIKECCSIFAKNRSSPNVQFYLLYHLRCQHGRIQQITSVNSSLVTLTISLPY
ncbi:hypothetical protein CW304_22530 [Bacillus sp. UFRGS-B20]|nr:hypothetical protein CW304_22530 [Bacillus sp. UFRGS-B20]